MMIRHATIDDAPKLLPLLSELGYPATLVEKNLLKEYLGRDPKINELKNLNIMKKVAMAIAGGNLIKAGIQMGCIVKPETPSDSLSQFLPKIGRGEIKLDSGENLYKFGPVLLKEI